MIRLLGDLVSQIMFLGLVLALGFCLAFFAIALVLWIFDKIQGLFK
jgi:hypothetical protein